MFKPSVFNISVGDNVIYNSYSGAILKLSQPIADCIVSAGSAQPIWVGKKHPI